MIYYTSDTSIYCYPHSNTLINKLDIKDQTILTQIETDITLNRIAELSVSPINGRFSLNHLLNIHKYIFDDIYPFAGKTRNENIYKGNTQFCNCEYIYENFNKLYDLLKKEDYLRRLPIYDFAERLGYYLSELNMIHPFREGNGRTIREYIRCLALYNNHIINWERIDKDYLNEATIVSVKKEYKLLTDCMYNALEK